MNISEHAKKMLAAMASCERRDDANYVAQAAIQDAYAAGFADGYNERDTEIPTGDNP